MNIVDLGVMPYSEALAVQLCEAAAKRIAPFTDGYYIMTPFQRVGLVCRVMRATRNLAE